MNDASLGSEFEEIEACIRRQRPAAEWKEFLRLLAYQLGASRVGYTLYRSVVECGGIDLKRLLSMEPTRVGEQQQDLQGDRAAGVTISEDRLRTFADDRSLRPFNRVKAACGLQIIRTLPSMYLDRWRRYERFQRWAKSVTGLEVLPLAEGGIPLRIPVVTEQPLSNTTEMEGSRFGLSKHYGTDYPMCGDPSLPNSTRLYRRLYTVPVHNGATDDVLNRLIRLLDQKIC